MRLSAPGGEEEEEEEEEEEGEDSEGDDETGGDSGRGPEVAKASLPASHAAWLACSVTMIRQKLGSYLKSRLSFDHDAERVLLTVLDSVMRRSMSQQLATSTLAAQRPLSLIPTDATLITTRHDVMPSSRHPCVLLT